MVVVQSARQQTIVDPFGINDEFDIILAWREDRLYRGLRSMLTVLETVQEYKIEILLAKETFDPTIAPVRAWAAQT